MSDYLVEIGANRTARNAIRKLGLPRTLPQTLRRATGPWEERPLHDMSVIAGHHPGTGVRDVLAKTLAVAGANTWVVGDGRDLEVYRYYGEAHGRMPIGLAVGEKPEGSRPSCLVLDATPIEDPGELEGVYRFFHDWIRSLGTCGRCLILARPPGTSSVAAATASKALEGFTRSLAKEIGRKGSTAQIVYVAPGSEDRVEPALRFLLSARSAFITGQPVFISGSVASDGSFPLTGPLERKVALVTGAARGIGAAIARVLAREGARVIVMDRPSEDGPAASVAHEIHGTSLLCDITDPTASETISEVLDREFSGRLDVIVHNAGITRDKMLANMDEQRWNQAMDVNLLSLMRVNEALLDRMGKDARIVCLASIAGIAGNTGQTNYAASKAGLIGYVNALAPSLAGKGIAMNAVAPGFIESKMTAKVPLPIREAGRRLSNLSQGGLPEDVAETVAFLSSPGAAGLLGQVLRICGGSLLGA